MEKKYILLIGGAGYIGSHVNKILNNQDYSTIVYDNLSRGNREHVKWGKFIEGCISDTSKLDKLFKTYNVFCVMHFAAFAYVGESIMDPSIYYTNNVANTIDLLNTMRLNNINNFIFSSTCATYGVPTSLPIFEDMEQKPINPYGRSKLMIENIIEDYRSAYNLNYVNLRYFNAAGCDPEGEIGELHDPEPHLIPKAIKACVNEVPLEIYGNNYNTKDGTCIRDYIHVMDVGFAHFRALKYLKHGSNSFNLGLGKGYSVMEIVQIIEKVLNKNIKLNIVDAREGDPPELYTSNKKARELLNWNPTFINLQDIIESAINWILK